MRSLRHEILSTASVLSIPLGIVLAFPSEAIRFRASSVPARRAAAAAFVSLTPEQQSEALAAAKTAWQSDASARPVLRLPFGELPEEPQEPLLDIGTCARPAGSTTPLPYSPRGWEPSLRSGAPRALTAEPAVDSAAAFSRDELLKLN